MNTCSDATFLKFRVPQGSVLGPGLFTFYTIPLGEICRRHKVFCHLYADDTQLFCTFPFGNDVELEKARRRIQNCISKIKMWMSFHFLKLNDDKTEDHREHMLRCYLPKIQGSPRFSPWSRTFYTIPLGEICRHHKVFCHLYALIPNFFVLFHLAMTWNLKKPVGEFKIEL